MSNHTLATLNALVAVASLACMLLGRRAITVGNRRAHRNLMLAATALQALFLGVFVHRFVVYGFTEFSGSGISRWIYFVVFLTHEPLAVVTIPLVITAVLLGLTRKYAQHRQIVAWTFPIWVYATTTGVIRYGLLYL